MTGNNRGYNHQEIEPKWQKHWQEAGIYKTADDVAKPKCYILDMFPYLSGEGLHVGHPKGYIATDVYSRFKRLNGFNVLHPMGWDAFGLPAENYAIKNKILPQASVGANVTRFKKQLEIIGLDHDWSREINTTDPGYYQWTQWIFLKLLEKGLAYQSYEPINWCPSCQTGLANEDLEEGKCERCGSVVEKKPMRQWVLKITDYADRLLTDLDNNDLNWPESIKESQRNWIGRSEGAEIEFKIVGEGWGGATKIFTTRVDTLLGVTYLVLAPEHKLVKGWQGRITNWPEVEKYLGVVKNKTEIERTAVGKEKTGIELEGIKAINPATGEKVPVWIADYVLADYGSGAVMAVPAHDERDFAFAKKYNLPVRQAPLIAQVEALKLAGGKLVVKYKLRDWVFSRQRYWGEPIPVIHCAKCGVVPVPEKDLPVKLPEVTHYEPTGTGESPLANITDWVNIPCPKCDGPGKRETNTMPQWAGSSWYYLRYIDPSNTTDLVDPEAEKYWSPVDLYVGGAEHATRHLIYARFWHKFLFDLGVVNYPEPFIRLHNVGLILASDGRKMSKRYGNIVNPDEIVNTYGADTLRIYEMFLGPFSQSVSWDAGGIIGPRRFLERVWNYAISADFAPETEVKTKIELQRCIKKVSANIEAFSFNTAISSLMIGFNAIVNGIISQKDFEAYLILLAPFAPHLTEELWQQFGHQESINLQAWPHWDEAALIQSEVKIVVQVNGVKRATLLAQSGESKEVIVERARVLPAVQKWLIGEPKKSVYIPNRVLNFVV